MSKIFISYRRHDSRPVATLIYDPLARHFEAKFGAGAVFMDVHGIPLGVNFRAYLNGQVGKAELLLALIADRWLTAVDEHDSRRIDSPNDFVRIEIEAALKRGIPVVPVYVDDAKILREADLPESLKELAWMNGFQLRTDARYFAADTARLISGLEPHLAPPPPVADDKARAKRYFRSGNKHLNKGEYDRAIADYDQAICLDPKYVAAFCNRGAAYQGKSEHDHAFADCDQAIKLDPKCANTYVSRAIAYNDRGDFDRAIADYDQAIRLDPKDTSVYGNRGNAYYYKGDYDCAVADYEQIIHLYPEYAEAYNNRGAAYNGKGDYDRAIADLDEAIRLDPKLATAYRNRGDGYRGKGEYDSAIADYDRAIAIDPNDQFAAKNKQIAKEKRAEQNKKKGWFGFGKR